MMPQKLHPLQWKWEVAGKVEKVLKRKVACTIPEAAEFVNLKRQVKSSVSVICID